jgi:hypothetical protein
MRNQPAVFLKLLVLLVPREMQVEHTGGVKAMSDEEIEQAIEMIKAMVDQKLGEKAKVVEGVAEPVTCKAPSTPDHPRAPVADTGLATVNPSKSP